MSYLTEFNPNVVTRVLNMGFRVENALQQLHQVFLLIDPINLSKMNRLPHTTLHLAAPNLGAHGRQSDSSKNECTTQFARTNQEHCSIGVVRGCAREKLCVEVDGPVHAEQREHDARRDAWLAAQGVRVLRVTVEELELTPAAVLERIARAAAPSTG